MIRYSSLACSLALLLGLGAPGGLAYELIGVRWTAGSADFRINPNLPASAGTAAEQVEILRCAAAAWRDQSRADFQFVYEGTTTRAGFNDRDGINNISFVDTDGGDALAATIISGRNGVATSFDIVFYSRTNGVTNRWSGPGEPATGTFDVQGVAVHELGHALGLDHSAVPQATMFASASDRALRLRTLDVDDRQGVEALYDVRTLDAPAVQITRVTPPSGPAGGGNEVIVEGVNFTYDSESQLFLGNTAVPGTLWNVESCTRIRVLGMPPGLPGRTSLRLVNSIGSQTRVDAYTYTSPPPTITSIEPSEGPLAGGIAVTIEGASFLPGAVFAIGGKPLLDTRVLDATTVTGRLPPGDAEGPADIRVSQGDQQVVAAGLFTYRAHVLAMAEAAADSGGPPVSVPLLATTPNALSAVSFGLVHDPFLLAIGGVSVEGTAAAAAELVTANVDSGAGVTTVEILMGPGAGNVIPAGSNVVLTRVEIAVAAGVAPGTETPVRLRDGVGTPLVSLTFRRAADGVDVRPFVIDGLITVANAVVTFVRGDANGDGRVDLSDAVFQLTRLFKGGVEGPCTDAADANDDGELDVSDVLTILLGLFRAADFLRAPYPRPGADPTPDALGCGT